MMYRFMVIASMVNRDTANKPYLTKGKRRHSNWPCLHDRCQNVEAASGKLKQQKLKSDTLRLMMNTAVALRTCNTIAQLDSPRSEIVMTESDCSRRAVIFNYTRVVHVDGCFRQRLLVCDNGGPYNCR